MDKSGKPTTKSSLPIEDVIAPLVFIIAIAGAIIAWHKFTGAPFWLSTILGILSGFAAVMATVWIFARLNK